MVKPHRLPLAARRVFRLAAVTALSLTLAYGLGLDVPFIAPLFAVLLTANPGPPPGAKQLLVLVLVLNLTLGIGVLLGPLLQLAPASALIAIALGLFFSNRLGIVGGKSVPATLLAFGFTVIPAASTVSQALAATLISALVTGVVVAVLCQWLLYPLFPEDDGPRPPPPAPPALTAGNWLSLRATLIVLPAFLFTLTNPLTYLPLTVKSILLGREATEVRLRAATRELVGSTALGGFCAIAVWLCLSLAVELLFFGGWIGLCALMLASGAYGVLRSTLAPGFWINTLTTMLILLGAAVQDSVNGKDVYQAFAVRMALFLLVTLYAVAAMALLERLRARRANTFRGVESC
ncbi:DUF2955 domain-containing protein [Parahaliea mediterranea]|uniref:DUF2955 domain-containing protein n=1 Tax=Parahaliea mediterranea TaxID=651086 RepID=A0A939DEK9_9GAMM|nr:DUF2955 domain-containing protein [Parahaliea mediterranea]MBN7796708.1 DUF2955 domain-containing protein [Parahaliea mediterranea]